MQGQNGELSVTDENRIAIARFEHRLSHIWPDPNSQTQLNDQSVCCDEGTSPKQPSDKPTNQ